LKINYSDETLGDKQLPRVVSYTSSASAKFPPAHCLFDPREQLRRDSFVKDQLPLVPYDIHQVLLLTSATWADSRGAQLQWIDRLKRFYLSLLCTESAQTETLNAKKVQQRLVQVRDLLPGEASRVVVEGYLPCQDDQNGTNENGTNGDWVILGYLSNFLDYPARAIRLKNNQQQFCHVLHGVLCSIPETMIWQARNSAQEDGIEAGVTVSRALAHYFPDQYAIVGGAVGKIERQVVLPQIRSMSKIKNGRLQIRDIKPRQKVAMENDDQKSIQQIPAGAPSTRSVILKQPPTSEQIRQEALSLPFGFLPFYESS
jgi:hypothetical protein